MKANHKTTLAYSLITMFILSGALGGCEPLSDHEKEMRSIEKETKKAKKDLKRLQRRIPDLDKLEYQFDREGLESAMNRTDWKGAKMYYERLQKRGSDLGDYPKTLETRMLDLVTPLPSSLYEFNYRGYDFLAVIAPDNQAYTSKATLYKNKIRGCPR